MVRYIDKYIIVIDLNIFKGYEALNQMIHNFTNDLNIKTGDLYINRLCFRICGNFSMTHIF